MTDLNQQIQADRLQAASSVIMGANSVIKAREVTLGNNVRIGDNVEIICDRLELGDDCSIGSGSVALCPEIVFEKGCSIGKSLQAELNDHLRLGRHSRVGNRVSLAGRGVKCGDFLNLNSDVVVGGGGVQGPRSYLEIGARSLIVDKAFINIAEPITIGDSTGISFGAALVTHHAWDPVWGGFPCKFGPIRIGNFCAVSFNVVVLPNVTIGDYSTIGACALVDRDVPPRSLACGVPARVVKGDGKYLVPLDRGQIDTLIGSILSDYVATLEPKDVRVIKDRLSAEQYVTLQFQKRSHTIAYTTETGQSKFPGTPDITLAYGEPPQESRGKCHFNLREETTTGDLSEIGDDLRDYLRRRGIRIFTGNPFRGLPLANLKRLKERRGAHD
jgi:acetyltransferase-like isoleucine patch superfamily enzyme